MGYNSSQRAHILRTLDDMLSSEWFANALQLQNFLHYIVSAALEDNSNRIKGYTIGVDALGKPADFDPATDPSVRVLAGRLRQAIDAYNRENQNKLIARISLKKGTYIPDFSFPKSAYKTRDNGALISSSENFFARKITKYVILPSLFVLGILLYLNSKIPEPRTETAPTHQAFLAKPELPTVSYEFSYDQKTMPEWISKEMAGSHAIVALSRFKEYRLLPAGSKSARSGTDYQITLLFSGSPLEDHLDVFITLYRSKSDEIVWSQRVSFPPPDEDTRFAASMSQVETIASNLFSAYGILYGDLLKRADLPPQLNCIRKIYNYFKNQTLQQYRNALACALATVTEKDAPSSMHALTALLFVEAYQRGFRHMEVDVLIAARQHASKAVSLDAGNARSFQALFTVERASGNIDAAILAGSRAMEQNPFDRDILGDFASFLVAINRLEQATPLLERAGRLTPTPPAWLQFYQFLHADLTDNPKSADQILVESTVRNSPLVAIANLLAFERNRDSSFLVRAKKALTPDLERLLETPEELFKRRGFSAELATRLADRISSVQKSLAYRRIFGVR